MCNRVRQTIRERLGSKDGTTLVEMIVTFTLIGLFMTAAASMLTSSLQLFGRMQSTSSAILVSDLILDKVAGEIVAAEVPREKDAYGEGYYFWLEPEAASPNGRSRWVVFQNRSRSPIAIFAAPTTGEGKADPGNMGHGQLFIRYYAVSKTEHKEVQEIDWHYDRNAYMNYTIQDLWFTRDEPDTHPNVIKINLTLKNEQTGFEYYTYRYAENYNYVKEGDYIGSRAEFDPDSGEFPKEADEFGIVPKSGGDSGSDGSEPDGSKPDNPEKGDFIVYFVSQRTGKELGRRDYAGVELNKPIGLTLPYIAGYTTPSPGWLEITFSDTVRSYTFYYEPILWDYTIHYWTRGNIKLLDDTYGKIYTDESIVVEAPVIPGYVPEFPNYTFTAVGDDVGGNRYTIYYDLKVGDSEHPFVTKGDKANVEENDGQAYWPWPEVAEKVKEFFNSPWHKVESGDKTGYYHIFVYNGQEYAIGGWEDKKGNMNEFEEVVKQQNGNPDCIIMVINSESSNSEVQRALLLYYAEQIDVMEADIDFIKNSSIKFEFDDGVNLKEIEIEEHKGNKKEIEIKYED